MEKLPDELFMNLKKECSYVENLRLKNIDDPSYRLITSIENFNNAKHYALKMYANPLKEYVLSNVIKYKQNFPDRSDSPKILTDAVPFVVGNPWINIQSKGESLPLHNHSGFYSYTIWVKIPYSYKEENEDSTNLKGPNGCFQFVYTNCLGDTTPKLIPLSSDNEGYMIMFPSKLYHMAYPFFKTDEYRISIAGNIYLDTSRYRQMGN
jgi:hypothetical protein